MTSDGWAELGRRIVFTRAPIWRTRTDFARVTGLSTRVLSDIETGRRMSYDSVTLARIEHALGWAPGSCLRVSMGEEPVTLIEPDLQRIIDIYRTLSSTSRAMLLEFAEVALRA